MKQLWKMARVVALAGSAMAAATPTANAQVTFAGNTFGCFYSAPTVPANCTGLLASTGSLTYTGSTFSVTSNPMDGLVSLGAAPGAPNRSEERRVG